jgi:DNA-binding NarL/FixJ family response regulator
MREYLERARADEAVAIPRRSRPALSCIAHQVHLRSPPHLRARARGAHWQPMLRLALVDDHPAVLAGLRRLIDSEPDLMVAAVGSDATELARELEDVRPDVLILDYDVARHDGLTQCARIKRRPDPPGVIIYSAYAGPALTLAARAAQADGVVDKAAPVPSLLTAIRRVADGDVVMPAISRDVFESAVARLDDDDLPVLAMLLDREALGSIARALGTERADVRRRAQRIVGRLRPRLAGDSVDLAIEAQQ